MVEFGDEFLKGGENVTPREKTTRGLLGWTRQAQAHNLTLGKTLPPHFCYDYLDQLGDRSRGETYFLYFP